MSTRDPLTNALWSRDDFSCNSLGIAEDAPANRERWEQALDDLARGRLPVRVIRLQPGEAEAAQNQAQKPAEERRNEKNWEMPAAPQKDMTPAKSEGLREPSAMFEPAVKSGQRDTN